MALLLAFCFARVPVLNGGLGHAGNHGGGGGGDHTEAVVAAEARAVHVEPLLDAGGPHAVEEGRQHRRLRPAARVAGPCLMGRSVAALSEGVNREYKLWLGSDSSTALGLLHPSRKEKKRPPSSLSLSLSSHRVQGEAPGRADGVVVVVGAVVLVPVHEGRARVARRGGGRPVRHEPRTRLGMSAARGSKTCEAGRRETTARGSNMRQRRRTGHTGTAATQHVGPVARDTQGQGTRTIRLPWANTIGTTYFEHWSDIKV